MDLLLFYSIAIFINGVAVPVRQKLIKHCLTILKALFDLGKEDHYS